MDPKTFESLKNIYEKISGFPIVRYNWNEIAENFTENKYLFSTDWAAIWERLQENSLMFSMSEEFKKYVNVVKETEGLSEEEFEKRFSVEVERSRE